MNRREFIKLSSLTLTGLGLNNAFASRHKLPNILIIYSDQHKADLLGCAGNKCIKTPNLDALAGDGVIYKNSFCCFPVCTPSRYSFFSGMYVNQHQAWTNHSTLNPALPSFPRVLKNTGYETVAVGKMHFTPAYLDIGFERMVLAEQDGPGRWADDYHRYLKKIGLVDKNDIIDQVAQFSPERASRELFENAIKPSNLPDEHYSTTWIADQSMRELKAWGKDKPNFLMVSFIKPHHPFDPPEPWDKMYDPAKIELPESYTEKTPQHNVDYNVGYYNNPELSEKDIRKALAHYYSTISQIDYHIGRLLTQLKETAMYDDTLIIYSSDHGEYAGHHHMLLKGNYMYEPIMKVPLIIKWPNNRKSGQTSNKLVNNIDIAPTIMELVNQPVPDMVNGLPIQSEKAHRYIFAEFHLGRQLMIRSEKYKLILDRANDNVLLFDLVKDPHEFDDLSDVIAYKPIVNRMKGVLIEWADESLSPKIYVDQSAPQIKQPNAPNASQIQQTKQYYFDRMEKFKS